MMLQRQALVIGNSDYALQPRISCIYDAYDMSYALESIGFLTDSAINLDSSDLKGLTYRFTQSIQPNSIVLFYFSGLAVQYDGNTYLMPTNNQIINTDNVKNSSLNVDDFIQDMVNKSPRAIIVILDCCRPSQNLITLRSFFDREPLISTQDSTSKRPPPSTIIGYSCALGQNFNALAANGRNSLYTYYLLHYIMTPNVDIHNVLKSVALNVQRDTGGRQVPDRYSSVQENLYLVINPYVKSLTWFDDSTSAVYVSLESMNFNTSQHLHDINRILPHSAYLYHHFAMPKNYQHVYYNFSPALMWYT